MNSATTTATSVAIQDHHPTQDVTLEVPMGLTQQDVIQITLTGPGLILTILGIIISINLFQPSLTCSIIALAPIPWIIYNDYHNFISLGPGGTPSTLLGYVKITYLRIFALSDPYSPPTVSEGTNPPIGYIQRVHPQIPMRRGPRPKVAGIAPQRQISHDNSFHMNLHPDDAKDILEKGWGERHPMAGASTPRAISNFLSCLPSSLSAWLSPRVVPEQFVLIYAPRDNDELQVVCHIIEAAAFWVSGEQFTLPIEGIPLADEPVGA
ncbi:hypothetical protein DID88_001311 [Monilinia fructigena]|uniref:Luciferase domain-containing protein n=1 Tax=Monilinia fructigena TaxID=38457 RepID=A0A395IY74_9HELO|nr:hypothetical protein DID88_001311 [Monilinia fructigena]